MTTTEEVLRYFHGSYERFLDARREAEQWMRMLEEHAEEAKAYLEAYASAANLCPYCASHYGKFVPVTLGQPVCEECIEAAKDPW